MRMTLKLEVEYSPSLGLYGVIFTHESGDISAIVAQGIDDLESRVGKEIRTYTEAWFDEKEEE